LWNEVTGLIKTEAEIKMVSNFFYENAEVGCSFLNKLFLKSTIDLSEKHYYAFEHSIPA
jgi:hypothetical protein